MKKITFKLCFDSNYLPLCMYALRLLGDKEESEDIVQTAFASAWDKLQNGDEIGNLRSYLYGTVRNLAYSQIRNNNAEASLLTEITDREDFPEEEIDTSERDARLWKAIAGLPEKCRRVFLMSKRDGMTNKEIADEMSISIKTVENQMTKAYSRLREALLPKGQRVFFLPYL